MKLDEAEPCIVEFEGKRYLVFRESSVKNSDYLFIECGIASSELMNAYFNELYHDC